MSTNIGGTPTPASSNEDTPEAALTAGKVCPVCGGLGYVYRPVPEDHPDYGRLFPCVCQAERRRAELRDRLYAWSRLGSLARFTFASFQPEGHPQTPPQQALSLRLAYEAAREFAARPRGWLLLSGPYGCGKTHLAAAIANAAVEQGIPALFWTVPDLLDELRQGYRSSGEASFAQRFQITKEVDLLVLDDLGTQAATEWAREKLFQLLNYRYLNALPTVITTNLALQDLDPRLVSRLGDPNLVRRIIIDAPDYRRPLESGPRDTISLLPMLADRTFATFQTNHVRERAARQALRKVLQRARTFAQAPQGWLILMGPSGTGKTHLAAAIANERLRQGEHPLFVFMPDLLDHLRATFRPDSPVTYDQRFEMLRVTPLLVLDDVGRQATSPWAREKLYQLLNYRHVARKPTVITTTLTIAEFEPWLRTRFLDQRLSRVLSLADIPSFITGKTE